jgi:membrane protein insertase Oxa1/YidC/SpoIIIJ
MPLMIFMTMINIYGAAINFYFFINNLLQVIQQKYILDKNEKEESEVTNESKHLKNAKEAKIIKKPVSSKGKSGTKITRITAKEDKRRGKK